LTKAALTAPVKAADGSSVTSIGKSSTKTEHIGTATWLENMPAGHMGKLLVYRSGVVKLRLGDTLYEVIELFLFRLFV
jgi:DNA-directed RNA polymerase III subunit RPC4